jgi:mono/diheme cytochrome c family protein
MIKRTISRMPRLWRAALAATLVCAAAGPAAGSGGDAAPRSAAAAVPRDAAQSDASAQGAKIFSVNCSRCHGVNMVSPGTGAYDLRTFPADDKPRFLESVTKGKNTMPPWEGVLTPEDIDLLWAYVTAGRVP